MFGLSQQIGIDGVLSASIAVGNRLQLFHALAKVGSEDKPATPAQVAEESGCKERYVKEWLSVMATGDLITVTEDEKFFIKKENIADLTGGTGVLFPSFLPIFMRVYDKLCQVFKKEGPLGLDYSEYTDFFNAIAAFSEAIHKEHLIPDLVPALGPNMKERLEQGGMMCLDVGCGKGFHAVLLAQNFPKSNFTGIDVTLEAVHLANQQRKDNGETFDNLAFIQMDGAKMDPDWTEKFDLVTIFDACHDQMRPDLCLKEIYRVLKPGGVFGMVEVKGYSSVFKNKQELGPRATMMYGASTFVCLPVASNSEDALGLGAMWGQERALKMLKDAGFSNARIVATPFYEGSTLSPTKDTGYSRHFEKGLMPQCGAGADDDELNATGVKVMTLYVQYIRLASMAMRLSRAR
ncbi:hypothetical protein Y032_0089g2289 [Ancylostoma ceylanicum]|uniref:Uncharacterized protein n=1 Tax=Ancylostoma ceylanicum TaxID=53326 RepID=A0A016TNH0_9BILA|nr:hypothetical protein Y032_0089g2289 [Ancylostoma ceylanicum]